MKRHLLAAGLTFILHVILGLTLSLRQPPASTPWQGAIIVSLGQLLERGPGEARAPIDPNSNIGDQGHQENLPQALESVKAVAPQPLPSPVAPKVVRPKKVAGEVKPRAEKAPFPDLGQPQPAASLELGTPREPDAAQEMGADATAADLSARSAPATTNNDSGAAQLTAPGGQGLGSMPVYKNTPEPQYPAMARRMGYQGTVELKVLVQQDGTVGELQVVTTSGYPVLDRSALVAVEQWRFEPGTRDAVQEAMWIKIPVHFKLR